MSVPQTARCRNDLAFFEIGEVTLPATRFRHAACEGRPTIRYCRIGDPALPAVAVLGGVSAHAVAATLPDGTPGWWDTQLGAGNSIDTNRFQVISIDYLGARHFRAYPRPAITTTDQADVLAAVLDVSHIRRLDCLVGASYGAMVGLAFAANHPDRLARLVAISGAHCAHPRSVAFRSVQRRILRFAAEQGRPEEGVALARALAVVGYRNAGIFAERFADNHPQWGNRELRFSVDDYLDHVGRAHAAHTNSDDYLCFSESLDSHAVNPARITVHATLVAVENDFLVPKAQMLELAGRLGGPRRLHVVKSRYGHDAFLKEHAVFARLLRTALNGGGRS